MNYFASYLVTVLSLTGGTSFNEKPYFEQKKCFSAKYVGWTEVDKSSGKIPGHPSIYYIYYIY